ncbi:MAG: HAMP domain-containing histidine kinase [Planctomycetes bacterium]|nr:HAMP domain-containing histidine kinase [Planctomycetota bacterium]MCB9884177.1 HAMP domain-containing histidine kinase [Planctomycetota bacterium]
MTAFEVERLPGVLGHELRNPLASAMTGVMLAREMVDEGDPRAAVLDGVLGDMDRMTGLIDGWLALARGMAGSTAELALGALLQRVAARHGAELVSLQCEATVSGSAAMLERALDNLLENARQAGARKLRLAVQSLGDEVTVHVEDDGCGVDPRDVDRLFAPGWSGRGGSGLGLFAVATTVAAHGGRIECKPLPRGTRFSLTLPASTSCTTCA